MPATVRSTRSFLLTNPLSLHFYDPIKVFTSFTFFLLHIIHISSWPHTQSPPVIVGNESKWQQSITCSRDKQQQVFVLDGPDDNTKRQMSTGKTRESMPRKHKGRLTHIVHNTYLWKASANILVEWSAALNMWCVLQPCVDYFKCTRHFLESLQSHEDLIPYAYLILRWSNITVAS